MESHPLEITGLPPFPDNVPIATLPCLSLEKLVARNSGEIQRLVHACEEVGLFYLDLRDVSLASKILGEVDQLFQTAVELFDLPLAEKQAYDFSSRSSHFGYKAQGAELVDQQGNVDRNEFYNVPRNDLLGITDPLPTPDVLKHHRGALQSLARTCHSIAGVLLEHLNTSLGLAQSKLLDLHRLDAPSDDIIRLIKAPPQPVDDHRVALAEHTDYGSITLVFNRLGGLQVLPPGPDSRWLYVKPMPNTVIVNIGEAMVKLTNGLLKSSFHRVVPPPGDQARFARYSVVYFCRPNNDVLLRSIEGDNRIPHPDPSEETEAITSKEWVFQGWLGRRAKPL
ncbi:hypothetical protein BDV26DRAFT_299709 [Aspergillus bertholletiae]|uniref:Fe2OG dioxygenase domain-containing protein n=1 Tax=Aspergillus bertholletiae TaxID=1226010 RepID=A0A5N7BKK0_9EURO|nr:hypothetical protein BDV26DRAFT_299709 [Aspergillus bertholletiae]